MFTAGSWRVLGSNEDMGLNHLDFAIIALYLAGITLFGLRFRKKQRSLRESWDTVRQVRNDACHPYPVVRERAAILRDVLSRLQRESVFSDLVRLKRRLRGDAEVSGGSNG